MLHWRLLNRPRHPLVRLALAVIGAALVAGVLVLGFFAVIAFAFIGGIVALIRVFARSHASVPQASNAASDPRVIEGEYAVIHDTRAVRH
ncbi:MAG TPA: hypothetical protein VHW73_11385 [Rudaea sp.]|jgi:hypothetical protein|nr:hypothetical protein [Rudaea sp.]